MSTILPVEHRCVCGKLLCKGFIIDGEIEIKCRRCGAITKLKGDSGQGENSHSNP